ncbi:MAG: hypothetical protein IMZ43_12280 [Thermoplasmata archaeon]|nr:hypothetical protein [Thermoplasmata archaeon]
MIKKYKLVIEVTYEQNRALDSELIRLLHSIPGRAMDDGMFTGETDAEVVMWSEKVEEI